MPYVRPDLRPLLDKGMIPGSTGELTYRLTKEVLTYLKYKGESFQTHGEILVALEAAKFEYYRRKVANYEDEKCKLNGDVFD